MKYCNEMIIHFYWIKDKLCLVIILLYSKCDECLFVNLYEGIERWTARASGSGSVRAKAGKQSVRLVDYMRDGSWFIVFWGSIVHYRTLYHGSKAHEWSRSKARGGRSWLRAAPLLSTAHRSRSGVATVVRVGPCATRPQSPTNVRGVSISLSWYHSVDLDSSFYSSHRTPGALALAKYRLPVLYSTLLRIATRIYTRTRVSLFVLSYLGDITFEVASKPASMFDLFVHSSARRHCEGVDEWRVPVVV